MEGLTIVHPDGTEELYEMSREASIAIKISKEQDMRKSEEKIAEMVTTMNQDNERTAKISARIASDMIRTAAAVEDLQDLLDIAPEWYEKREKLMKEQEDALHEFNRKWGEAHRDLELGVSDLLGKIGATLNGYFFKSGKGVRKSTQSEGLVEVFLGGNRTQSKVSVQLNLTFEGKTTSQWMFRNERLDDLHGSLSPKDTVNKLMVEVKKADKKGFWDEEEEV